uniref:Small glutamine-rich tetratricopeptide repeat-containing protein 2 n=1 Tax=Lygus hesperus TaxID=30085 RepID=A0A0A9WZ43_LYGHE
MASTLALIEPDDQAKAQAETFKAEGNRLLLDNKLQDSFEMYTRAIANDFTNSVYWVNRATVLQKLSKLEQALQDAEYAADISPKYMKAHFRLGVILYDLHNYPRALRAFTQAKCLCNADDTASANRMQNYIDMIQSRESGGTAARGLDSGASTAPAAPSPSLPNLGDLNLENLSAMARNLMGAGGRTATTGNAGSNATPNLEALMSNPDVQKMMGNFMNLFTGSGGSNASQ